MAEQEKTQATDPQENLEETLNASNEEVEMADDSNDENASPIADELADLSVEELVERLQAAEAKADENYDLALRTKAEAENVRRRAEKDVESARKFGVEKLATELLPVMDSMELGLAAAKGTESEADALSKIFEGMELTLKMLNDCFDKIGIQQVDPVDEPFNPELHQAMTMVEVEGKATNTVVAVMQKGYLLNDRLLRPALVQVAK